MPLNVLFIGDVVGKPGRALVRKLLPDLRARRSIDFTIANGENIAGGFGVTERAALELFDSGVDIITTGNHVWDRKEGVPFIQGEDRVVRPANYPQGAPGVGWVKRRVGRGGQGGHGGKTCSSREIAVLNLSGRVFMQSIDCPFATVERELEALGEVDGPIIVDFHAEATSEKIAFGYYLDGRVSAVLCTHTHVQTADEKILPGGTAYITDVGMTGPSESVIGLAREAIIKKFLSGLPQRYEVAKGPVVLSAVLVGIDESTNKAVTIERLMIENR